MDALSPGSHMPTAAVAPCLMRLITTVKCTRFALDQLTSLLGAEAPFNKGPPLAASAWTETSRR